MRWLKIWWPAIAWAIVISSFSTGAFTSEHTSRFIIPVLHWLLPHASPETLSTVHHVIRKCGHFTEYFILSLLILRGFQAGNREFGLRLALLSILMVAGYAALDEFHQSFVPGRGAAVSDVLLDTSGGAAGILIVALLVPRGRVRRQRKDSGEHGELGAKRAD
ncbi:MAG TPA: VanZ family protein [Candidatus Acidoferrales bacterium]|nr:VanZ family protein [Candidatus Acidoferrales bacterium]